MAWCVYFLLGSVWLHGSVWARAPLSFRLGSVFLAGDTGIHESFRQTVRALNDDTTVLNGTRVDTDLQYAKPDRYDAYQRICTEVQYSVMAVFGSSPPEVDTSVASVCSALHIPYLSTGKAFSAPGSSGKFTVQLGPQATHLVSAVEALVKSLEWTEIGFVFHRSTASLDATLLIERLQLSGIQVHFLELVREDIRPDLVKLRTRGVERFVVDVTSELLETFFDLAMKSGIVHARSTFVLADLDYMSVNLNSVTQTGSNVLGFSLIDQDRLRAAITSGKISSTLGSLLMETYEAALLYDGINLFARAVEIVGRTKDIVGPRVKCDDPDAPYNLGEAFMEALQEVRIEGVSSGPGRPIILERIGPNQGLFRTEIHLDVVRLLEGSGGRQIIGEWNWRSGSAKLDIQPHELALLQLRHPEATSKLIKAKFQNLIVQAHEDPSFPFLNPKRDSNGNVRGFEGYLVDLVNSMAKDLSFNYTLRFSGRTGQPSQGQNWTGLIRKLIDREADIGLAALPMTKNLHAVLDFSPPIVTSRLTLMIQRPSGGHPTGRNSLNPTARGFSSPVSFLDPFPVPLWMSILVAFVVTSLLLFLVGRISPYERRATANPGCFGDGLSLCGSFWLTFTGFFLRGSNISPKSISTRFLTCVWWLFCLCILILYITSFHRLFFLQSGSPISQLSSGVTKKHHQQLPPSLDQVLGNANFKVAATQTVKQMLMMSKDPLHERLCLALDLSLDFPDSKAASKAVLQDPNLGFIVESVQAETLLRNGGCHLTTVGDLGHTFYAIAFPKGSNLRDPLSEQILKYAEDGTLFQMRSKWMPNDAEAQCPEDLAHYQYDSLDATDYYASRDEIVHCRPIGPFLMLLICGFLSVVLAVLELVFYAFITARRRRQETPQIRGSPSHQGHPSPTVGHILKEELQHMLRCSPPAAVASSSTGSSGNGNYRFANGDPPASANNSPYKSNLGSSYFQQTQALLRKDNQDDANSQL